MNNMKILNLSLIFFSVMLASCNPNKEENNTVQDRLKNKNSDSISCGAEEVDFQNNTRVFKTNTSLVLSGGDNQDSTISYKGSSSLKLNSSNQFGFTYSEKNANPNTKYSVSVYRKSTENKGLLILDAGISNDIKIYKKKYYPAQINGEKWQKITLEYVTPSDYNGEELKVFCWNPDNEDVWFDDLSIIITKNYHYPIYNELTQVNLYVTDSVLKLFNNYRKSAFKRSILVKAEKEQHDVEIELEGIKYRATARLKGDWLDHIQGNKWSFRIKLKDDKKWRGMDQFAFQNPHRRDFLNEWLFHKIVAKEGLITTEYEFVDFKLNGKSLGLYVYEEQFGQNMITKKGLNKGIILKYNEDAVWQVNEKLLSGGNTEIYYPVVPASYAEPFNKKKVFSDKKKAKMFYKAQKLMFNFKLENSDVTKIFHIDKLAKFYALSEIGKASHGFIFHNLRYYYNDSTGLLEPISYDNYNDKGEVSHHFPVDLYNDSSIYKLELNDRMGDWMLKKALNNRDFLKKYMFYLNEYLNNDFMNSIETQFYADLEKYVTFLNTEFDFYEYNYDFIKENIKELKEKYVQYEFNFNEGVYPNYFFKEPIDKMTKDDPKEDNIGVLGFYDKRRKVVTLNNLTGNDVLIFDKNGNEEGTLYYYKGINLKRFVSKNVNAKPNWNYKVKNTEFKSVKILKFGFYGIE